MTINGSHSLKPQTVSLIQGLEEPVKLIGLYPKLKKEGPAAGAASANAQDFYQPVADILDEYRRKGKNITSEMIDPVGDPAKFEQWTADLKEKYGGDAKPYQDLLAERPRCWGRSRKPQRSRPPRWSGYSRRSCRSRPATAASSCGS